MKFNILAGAAALAIMGAAPLAAQNYGRHDAHSTAQWDHNSFWRAAPNDPRQRIDFLQQRIDRGMTDGSLNRQEARRAQNELKYIRNYARQGRWTTQRSNYVQLRLDNLSKRIKWMRQYGDEPRGQGRYAVEDPRFRTSYDARSHYRAGPNYAERRLGPQDEVYRGSDGQYYCKRNDGTTGLIIGGIGGAGLGNIIDGGHSRAAGTLIGGALGALLGKSIDQNSDVRCR